MYFFSIFKVLKKAKTTINSKLKSRFFFLLENAMILIHSKNLSPNILFLKRSCVNVQKKQTVVLSSFDLQRRSMKIFFNQLEKNFVWQKNVKNRFSKCKKDKIVKKTCKFFSKKCGQHLKILIPLQLL